MCDAAKLRALNDSLRTTFNGGRIVATPGILARTDRIEIFDKIRTFDQFTPDSDSHSERDFGAIEIDGQLIFWKIDCYDVDLQFGSPDPCDPAVTARVMTILLASEY
jgi:Protein of unknown function (DUF3768)